MSISCLSKKLTKERHPRNSSGFRKFIHILSQNSLRSSLARTVATFYMYLFTFLKSSELSGILLLLVNHDQKSYYQNMKDTNLTIGQKRTLAEFFTNSAVAWLSAGIIAPFFVTKKFLDFITFGFWGIIFALTFLGFSLYLSKGIK